MDYVQQDFGRAFGRSLVARLRHPRSAEKQRDFLETWYLKKYFSTKEVTRMRKGVKDLPNWSIDCDPTDPDFENRRLLAFLYRLPTEVIASADYFKSRPIGRLLEAIVADTLTDGFQGFLLEVPHQAYFNVTNLENGEVSMSIPETMRESLVREIAFAESCEPYAYFAVQRGGHRVETISHRVREDGKVEVRITAATRQSERLNTV